MKKEELLKEIERMVTAMNANTFLLPNGWSDRIDMDLQDWSYVTYCSRSTSLYINIDIYKEEEKIFEFHFNFGKINVTSLLGVSVTPKKMYDYIKLIYDEKHSFSEHDEGLKSLREKLRDERNKIKSANKQIKELTSQMEGLKQLQSK